MYEANSGDASSARRGVRLGVVAGTALDPWDVQIFPALARAGFSATILGSADPGSGVPVRSVETVRDFSLWRRIPLLEKIGFKIHGFGWDRGLGFVPSPFALDDAIVGLRGLVRDMDALVVFETYRASTYQSCRDHPAVVVKVTENIPHNPHPWPYERIRHSVRRRARRFVCVTESARKALLAEGCDADRIQVIPESVDTEVFRPPPVTQPEDGPLTVGYAAKMDVAHGLPQLLEAFARVSESSEARLRIAGDGVFGAELPSMVRRLGIDPRSIDHVGPVPYSQMPNFLQGIDVLCVPCRPMPGWRPQFGIVNIEAMACGRPVVATDAGATSEVFPPALQRFLAPPGDVGALAERLLFLASDPSLRARLGREAREWTEERYDVRRVAVQWASALSEVLEEVQPR